MFSKTLIGDALLSYLVHYMENERNMLGKQVIWTQNRTHTHTTTTHTTLCLRWYKK